jgi:hypothetical protein
VRRYHLEPNEQFSLPPARRSRKAGAGGLSGQDSGLQTLTCTPLRPQTARTNTELAGNLEPWHPNRHHSLTALSPPEYSCARAYDNVAFPVTTPFKRTAVAGSCEGRVAERLYRP